MFDVKERKLLSIAQQLKKQQEFKNFVQNNIPNLDEAYYAYQLKHYYETPEYRERLNQDYKSIRWIVTCDNWDGVDSAVTQQKCKAVFEPHDLFGKLLTLYKLHQKNEALYRRLDQETCTLPVVLWIFSGPFIAAGIGITLKSPAVFGALLVLWFVSMAYFDTTCLIHEKIFGLETWYGSLTWMRPFYRWRWSFIHPSIGRDAAMEDFLLEDFKKSHATMLSDKKDKTI